MSTPMAASSSAPPAPAMVMGLQSCFLPVPHPLNGLGHAALGPNHLVTCQDWFFQWAFCVTGATIVSGGVAERLQLGGYLIFTAWMTGVIYPCVGAMTWGGGFLYDM